MGRPKKIKNTKRRTCDDDEENVLRYDVVLKNSVLYKEPAHTHERVVLYGDIIMDMNSFI